MTTDLTSIDLDNPTAKDFRAIDVAIAEKLFEVCVTWTSDTEPYDMERREALAYYSQDPAFMFQIIQAMAGRIFSRRTWFLAEVKVQISYSVGCNVAWPDALFHMKPLHVCIAALKAEGVL